MKRLAILLLLLVLSGCGEGVEPPSDWQDRAAVDECGEDVIDTTDPYVFTNSHMRRDVYAKGTSLETAITSYPRKDGGVIQVYERLGRDGWMVLGRVTCGT